MYAELLLFSLCWYFLCTGDRHWKYVIQVTFCCAILRGQTEFISQIKHFLHLRESVFMRDLDVAHQRAPRGIVAMRMLLVQLCYEDSCGGVLL